jgi:hypothetical protein
VNQCEDGMFINILMPLPYENDRGDDVMHISQKVDPRFVDVSTMLSHMQQFMNMFMINTWTSSVLMMHHIGKLKMKLSS